jgi:glycosyltransferase involved in cell wall biosynthesis
MQRYPNLKWIYSSWGSDLYHFRNIPKDRKDLERVLPRIDYLFTDNKRDFGIAKSLGFKATFLGAFPGGGGFNISELEPYVTSFDKRNTIIVKGYQGRSGRAITVLKVLLEIEAKLESYKIVVFAADEEVAAFLKTKNIPQNWSIEGRMGHLELLKLMGKALIYIGNSASDGMPNTLLEAIVMGAFPIQSNPGSVTEEIIHHGENGLLISNAEDSEEIKDLILEAISNKAVLKQAFSVNQKLKRNLDFKLIKTEVLQCYTQVAQELNT